MSPSIESAKGIFINQESELRCGWRIFLFVVAFTVVTALIGVTLSTLEVLIPSLRHAGEPSEPQGYLSDRTLICLVLLSRGPHFVVAATVVCARLLERRSFGSVGFKFIRAGRDTLLGCVIGGAAIALAVGIASLGGAVSIEPETQLGAPVTERSVLLAAALLRYCLWLQRRSKSFVSGIRVSSVGSQRWSADGRDAKLGVFGIAHLEFRRDDFFDDQHDVGWRVAGACVSGNAELVAGNGSSLLVELRDGFVFGLPVSSGRAGTTGAGYSRSENPLAVRRRQAGGLWL
jgi:hypothetical protein